MQDVQIFWAILALALLGLEALVPGAFMLWFGFAAGAMFLVTLAFPELSVLWQAVIFVALSFVSISIYLKWFRNRGERNDSPGLNRKGDQLMGLVVPLDQPIVDGRGRVKIGDAYWTVQGPDLPAATKVRVIAVDSMTLKVAPAE